MLRPNRQNRYVEFGFREKWISTLLLAAVFGIGVGLSFMEGVYAVITHVSLWVISYPVIYAGTCRHCAYYGKKCPVPLEGSCVHRLFHRGAGPFGWLQLFWAVAAYFLRVIVPAVAIVRHGAYFWGAVFAMALTAFWIVHLRVAGCPNCINTSCPLNPDSAQP